MRKKIGIYVLVFSVIFMILKTVVLASDVIENNNSGIPDKGLYQAILNILNKKSNQKFTKREAEKIKVLDASFSNVKSLKGIGYLKNLESLGIQGNHLKNLKGIQNLKNFFAYSNQIKSIKQLKI